MRSEIRDLCRQTFRETVLTMEIPRELKVALKVHERVPVFIDNLAKELSTTQFKVTKEHVIQATRDLTKTFALLVERQAKERVMSDIGKAMIRDQADKQVQLQRDVETLEGLGTEDVITTKEGSTLKQTIAIDETNLDALKEISER